MSISPLLPHSPFQQPRPRHLEQKQSRTHHLWNPAREPSCESCSHRFVSAHPRVFTCSYPGPWAFSDVLSLNSHLGKTLLKLVLPPPRVACEVKGVFGCLLHYGWAIYDAANPVSLPEVWLMYFGHRLSARGQCQGFFDGDGKRLLQKTEKCFTQTIANPLCSCTTSSIYPRIRQRCNFRRSRKEQRKLQRFTKLGLYIALGTGSPWALHPLVCILDTLSGSSFLQVPFIQYLAFLYLLFLFF